MSKLKFNAILAMSKNYGIGYKGNFFLLMACVRYLMLGNLPWNIPKEMNYFHTTTTQLKKPS
jgi:dihydrofolate reductase